jgi:hypothetical protein
MADRLIISIGDWATLQAEGSYGLSAALLGAAYLGAVWLAVSWIRINNPRS